MRDPAVPSSGLTRYETAALIVAAAAHAALLAALSLSPPGKTIKPPPERMEVTFSDEVALQATSPDPAAQAAPDVAPELGEVPPEPEPVVQPAPQPAPVPPRPVPAPPKPQPAPPKPAPPKPAPAKPVAQPAKPADTSPRRRPDAPSGGSRIGNDFLKGIPGATAPGTAKTPPAPVAGPQVQASLRGEISRQLKPNWTAPQGVEVDQLRTIVEWQLNPDGSLAGTPRVVDQLGVTDANRAQSERHKEQALRAIRLAAPFRLPSEYYANWRRVRFEFNRNLSK